MASEAELKLRKAASEGLAMFSTDFTSNGLPSAGTVCQKRGNICLDNIGVQVLYHKSLPRNQYKYVNSVGEHFRKVLDEVANDWFHPLNGIVEQLISDLSLENVNIPEVCESLRGRNDRYRNDEKFPHCVELDTFDYTAKDMVATMPQDMSRQKETSCPTLSEDTRSNCSGGTGQCNKNVSEAVASLACTTGSHSSVNGIPPSEFHHNEVIEGDLTLSNHSSLTEKGGSYASGSSTESHHSDCEKQNEPTLMSSLGLHETAVTGSPDSFDMETMISIHGMVATSIEPIHEFEDIKMEDFCDGAEKYELTLIPYWAPKTTSYKKKFKNAFSLKASSSNSCQANNMLTKPGIVSSSFSNEILCTKTITSYSCDCDWKLL